MQVDVRVVIQEVPYELRLVSGEIVENDVNLWGGWAAGNHFR